MVDSIFSFPLCTPSKTKYKWRSILPAEVKTVFRLHENSCHTDANAVHSFYFKGEWQKQMFLIFQDPISPFFSIKITGNTGLGRLILKSDAEGSTYCAF